MDLLTEINDFYRLSGLITEQGPFIKKVATSIDYDDLIKIIKQDISGDDYSKAKSLADDVARLNSDEFFELIRYLDPEKFAKKLLSSEIIFSKNIIEKNYLKYIDEIKNGSRAFDETISNFRKLAEKDFFRYIPEGQMTDELRDIANKYVDNIESDFSSFIKANDEELYDDIMSFGVSQSEKQLSKFNSLLDNFVSQNAKVIKDAYLNLFKSFDKISKEIDTVFIEIAQKRTKSPSANIESEIKKIESLISSAVGKDKRLYDDIMNEVYTRNSKYMDVTPYTKNHIKNKIDNLKVILKNEKTREWGSMDAFKMYINAWLRLFNIKNIKSLEWWKRLMNVIIQNSPYTPEEIAKRIRTSGVGQVVAGRLVATAFTVYVVTPVIYGTLKSIYHTFKYIKEYLKFITAGLSGDFTIDEVPLKYKIKEAYKSSFPDSLLDVALFNSWLDEIYFAGDWLANLDPKSMFSRDELEKAENGLKIIKGEEVDDPKTQDVRIAIRDKYPDIPTEFLNTRVHLNGGKAFYYELDGKDFSKQYPIMAKGDKIYVVNTDINKAIEINKIYK